MRIEQTNDPSQGQVLLHQRPSPPPAAAPPRRVGGIGQATSGEDAEKVSTAPPDDAIQLDLSPEGREAARKANLDKALGRGGKADVSRGEADPVVAEREADEQQEIEELRQAQREVRAHEQVVRAAAGNLRVGTTAYSYKVGPDGRLYVVGGEVDYDTSEVPGDPEATLRKAEQIQRAALATGEPSSQDRAAATMANVMAARARQELHESTDETGDTPAQDGETPVAAVR